MQTELPPWPAPPLGPAPPEAPTAPPPLPCSPVAPLAPEPSSPSSSLPLPLPLPLPASQAIAGTMRRMIAARRSSVLIAVPKDAAVDGHHRVLIVRDPDHAGGRGLDRSTDLGAAGSVEGGDER